MFLLQMIRHKRILNCLEGRLAKKLYLLESLIHLLLNRVQLFTISFLHPRLKAFHSPVIALFTSSQ